MKRFSTLKPENSKKSEEKVLFEEDSFKVIKYEDWSIVNNKDVVICIPFFTELNKFIIRQEYVPSFKFRDGQQQHLSCVMGSIEMGETPEEALYRELQEEAGIVLRDGYKIEFDKPIFFMKGVANKFYPAIIPLTENDYHETKILGDGSLLEKMSSTAKIDTKYLNSMNSSDLVTEYMIGKLKDYLNIS